MSIAVTWPAREINANTTRSCITFINLPFTSPYLLQDLRVLVAHSERYHHSERAYSSDPLAHHAHSGREIHLALHAKTDGAFYWSSLSWSGRDFQGLDLAALGPLRLCALRVCL